MSFKYKGYKAQTVGELFEQTRPKEVMDKLETKKHVVYSIIHSYTVNKKKIVHDYFQLDKDYNVVGILTDAETTEIEADLLKKSGKMDSILNTIEFPK